MALSALRSLRGLGLLLAGVVALTGCMVEGESEAGDELESVSGEGEAFAAKTDEAGEVEVVDLERDADEDVGEAEQELAGAGKIEVAQCNPYYAGRYPKGAWKWTKAQRAERKDDWGTMRAFAVEVKAKHPNLAVIGMQEIDSPGLAQIVAQKLTEGTGKPWGAHFYGRKSGEGALPSTGEAIFYRSDLVEELEDFGTKEVEKIDKNVDGDKAVEKKSFSVRFGGALLRKKGTTRAFGFFTGKLTWLGQKTGGVKVTNDHRANEIDVLQRWIDEKMAKHPRSSRIVVTDLNAAFKSKPWWHMRDRYYDANASKDSYLGHHFKDGTRLDYVFWDYDAGPKRKDGFFGKPTLSSNFGSDHLAVFANVYVRANDPSGNGCQVTCCDGAVKSASASSESACREAWTVCKDNGYADVIRWKGDAIYDKGTCGG